MVEGAMQNVSIKRRCIVCDGRRYNAECFNCFVCKWTSFIAKKRERNMEEREAAFGKYLEGTSSLRMVEENLNCIYPRWSIFIQIDQSVCRKHMDAGDMNGRECFEKKRPPSTTTRVHSVSSNEAVNPFDRHLPWSQIQVLWE